MIKFNLERNAFEPGEPIVGQVSWQLLSDCDELHIRLIWYTSGKGQQDFAIVQQSIVQRPNESGEFELQFVAPAWPHSFSGKLITLSWAIEVIRKPSNQAARFDLVIGPERRERSLQSFQTDVVKPSIN